jgi:trimethylamine-N-oxide reductase (cytochrome c)
MLTASSMTQFAGKFTLLGKPGRSADRGGCMNILSPDRYMSKYASGMAPNTAQIEVEKWDGGIYETEESAQ